MNSLIISALRTTAIVATLFVLPAIASAKNDLAQDRANDLLATAGALSVKAAGPYVEVGTFRIQVSAKLGQPAERLADGTWLYKNFAAEQSTAHGTLVVRFTPEGRVSQLLLATPAVVAALRVTPNSPDRVRVASTDQR